MGNLSGGRSLVNMQDRKVCELYVVHPLHLTVPEHLLITYAGAETNPNEQFTYHGLQESLPFRV